MSAAESAPAVLLVEPQFVLRRTLCAVAAELGLARVTEAVGIEAGQARLAAGTFDALVLGSVDDPAATRWIGQIRSGEAGCPKDLRIVSLLTSASVLTDAALTSAGVDAVLRKPFKVADVFNAVARQL